MKIKPLIFTFLLIVGPIVLAGCANLPEVKQNIYSNRIISPNLAFYEGQSFCISESDYPDEMETQTFLLKAKNVENFVYDKLKNQGFVKKLRFVQSDPCDFIVGVALSEKIIEDYVPSQESLTSVPFYTNNNTSGGIRGQYGDVYYLSSNSRQLDYHYEYEKQEGYKTSEPVILIQIFFSTADRTGKLLAEFKGIKPVKYNDFNEDAKELISYIFSKDITPLIKEKPMEIVSEKLPILLIRGESKGAEPTEIRLTNEGRAILAEDFEVRRLSELYKKEINALADGFKFVDEMEKKEFDAHVREIIATNANKIKNDEDFLKMIRDTAKAVYNKMSEQRKEPSNRISPEIWAEVEKLSK